MKPAWTPDGEPANLAAAAEDALEWLKATKAFIRRCGLPKELRDQGMVRLTACIAALERELGKETT
jgi:hypothetical protein